MTAKISIDKMWELGKGFFGRKPKEVIVQPSQIYGFTMDSEDGKIFVNVHSNALSLVVMGKDGDIAADLTFGLYNRDGVHISGKIGEEKITKDPEYRSIITDEVAESG